MPANESQENLKVALDELPSFNDRLENNAVPIGIRNPRTPTKDGW